MKLRQNNELDQGLVARIRRRQKQVGGVYQIQAFPEEFTQARLFEIGEQETDYSCGLEQAKLACRLQGRIHTDDRIAKAIELTERGVDPYPLFKGLRRLGVMCSYLKEMNARALKGLLLPNIGKKAYIWSGQDQETSREDLMRAWGGHYMMAVYGDHRNVYFADSGCPPTEGGGKSYLLWDQVDDLWYDIEIATGKIYRGVMIELPVTVGNI